MKYAKIIARANIKGVDSDEGLFALDGIFESPFYEFEDETSEYEMLKCIVDKHEDDIARVKADTTELIAKQL